MSEPKLVTIDDLVKWLGEFNIAYMGKFGDLTEESFKTWYKYLNDLDAEYFGKACEYHIKTCKEPPTIAHIRTAYENLWGEWQDHVGKVHNLFDSACGRWPGVKAEDEQAAREIWDRICFERRDNWKLHIKNANALLERCSSYVAKRENEQTIEGIEPFREWLEGFERKVREMRARKAPGENVKATNKPDSR